MRAVALLLLAMTVGAWGQQPEITLDTPVSSEVMGQWLQSGDARLVAWAATLARTRQDRAVLALMPGVLEHWRVPPVRAWNPEQRLAVAAVLDALTVDEVPVPVETIHDVAEAFPAQAAVLIARLPAPEARSTLNDWSYGGMGGWDGRMLARVASMMLAGKPDPEFVGRVVRDAEEVLLVSVIERGGGFGSGGGGACGDYMMGKPPAGWPEVYSYDLVENGSEAGMTVVDLDGDRVAARRFMDHLHPGSCNGVENLDAVTRHRLIAHWLGAADKELQWHARQDLQIVWKSQADYEQQLGAAVEVERKKLAATVKTLRERGLLREGDGVMPRLVVSINCAMTPCPLAQ